MLKLYSHNNGVKALNFISTFHHFLLYSSSSSTSTSSSFANYLVENLGFSEHLASITSRKFEQVRHCNTAKTVSSYKFVTNANSVVEFLKQIELNDAQIRKALTRIPHILLSKVDQTLKPKIESLEKFGLSKSDIVEVVSVNPYVLVNGQSLKVVEVLKGIMECDDHVISMLKKANWLTIMSISNNLLPNVALLRSYGLPMKVIRERLLRQPSAFYRKNEFLKDVLIMVEEKLGIPRDDSNFLNGIHLLSCLSDKNIDSKFKMFESFGWMRSDVEALIKRNPCCLGLSEARIKRSLEFLMKELGYEPAYLIAHYALINYSLEKRLVPRHRILLALKEQGLIRKDYSLYSTLSLNEAKFLKKYVLPYEEVYEVYAKLTGSPVMSVTKGRAG